MQNKTRNTVSRQRGKFTGFLFESLATHELRVYVQANDAKVYHYCDSSGLEVNAIVQKY